ncbi:signal recognition particle-docking protein FtsY [Buchnera aphidicola (Thelaxes californica)]|uniref:Signal recognition particle receptor FtsY n=1 Tax=Buchnera aphidicola (Thelaxes californica) TaxID=1315998 RepID=A0A4D6YJC9_9GAMM|nr:signal recognition particle-docking protein FtsY [Buchnera aphidicola]QCI26581.1 signal recognition particle-docking protein FtsY [Buchnera aphidicola (Thelaxes californica)]
MNQKNKTGFFSFFNFKKETTKKKETNKTSLTQNNEKNFNQTNTSKNIFQIFVNTLKKTKEKFNITIKNLFYKKKIDAKLFKDIEETLIKSDIGIITTQKIIHQLIQQADYQQLKNANELYELLKTIMVNILNQTTTIQYSTQKKPFFILIVGVNGSGKTTTIGKLTKRYKKKGKSVLLAAGDTFRAAAIDQLLFWSKKNNVTLIHNKINSDPASIIFDALSSAKSKNIDIVIADTAGRVQNKIHLMEELKKIIRVSKKINPNFPHEIMLVIDACSGQNVLDQVNTFNKNLGITSLIITKLDGTAKGGVIFSVIDQYKIPVRYIGIGEKSEDLYTFNAQHFVNALFE